MNEKEKMITGKPYNSGDDILTADRQHAKEITYDFNMTRPNDTNKKNTLIKELLGSIGDNFHIEQPFRCDYGYNISIGENFFSNYNCTILDCAKVTIGNNVLFAPNVCLFTAGHPIHFEPRNAGVEYAFPITIGDNVWIGGSVIINPGVTIGSNVVIGSGSVVTSNIPDNSIAVGNPCKILREITDEDKEYYFKNLKIIG